MSALLQLALQRWCMSLAASGLVLLLLLTMVSLGRRHCVVAHPCPLPLLHTPCRAMSCASGWRSMDSARKHNEAAWLGAVPPFCGCERVRHGTRSSIPPSMPRALLSHTSCSNMGLYLKKVMGYPAGQASQLLQVWKATVRREREPGKCRKARQRVLG